LRLFSFGGYGLALAALALVVFGAYDSYPKSSGIGDRKKKPGFELYTIPNHRILFGYLQKLYTCRVEGGSHEK